MSYGELTWWLPKSSFLFLGDSEAGSMQSGISVDAVDTQPLDITTVATPQNAPIGSKSFEYSSNTRREMYQGVYAKLATTAEMVMTPPPVAKPSTTTSQPDLPEEPNTVQKLVDRANAEIPAKVRGCPGTKVKDFWVSNCSSKNKLKYRPKSKHNISYGRKDLGSLDF